MLDAVYSNAFLTYGSVVCVCVCVSEVSRLSPAKKDEPITEVGRLACRPKEGWATVLGGDAGCRYQHFSNLFTMEANQPFLPARRHASAVCAVAPCPSVCL